MNSYRQNEEFSDIFVWTILHVRHYCFMFKYSTTESSQMKLLLGKHN